MPSLALFLISEPLPPDFWDGSSQVRQDIEMREGVGALPLARASTQAANPDHNDYRYARAPQNLATSSSKLLL